MCQKKIPIIKDSRCQGHRDRDLIQERLATRLYPCARGPKSKLLLVFVDTFTEWVEAFPCSIECARVVVQVLITEIIPCFCLPKSLQSDNGPVFKIEVTQGLSRALGIEYHLHCAWHPQSSGKVEKTNELSKIHLAKLAQETHCPWTKLLPIAPISLRNISGK
jgi:hypothetical protein